MSYAHVPRRVWQGNILPLRYFRHEGAPLAYKGGPWYSFSDNAGRVLVQGGQHCGGDTGRRHAGRLAGPGVGQRQALLVAHAARVAQGARPLGAATPLWCLVCCAVPACHPSRPPPRTCSRQSVNY